MLQGLSGDRYVARPFREEAELFHVLESEKQQIDCLILQDVPQLPTILQQLSERRILLPIVVLTGTPQSIANQVATGGRQPLSPNPEHSETQRLYHLYYGPAITVDMAELGHLPSAISLAIAEFLKLSPPGGDLPDSGNHVSELTTGSLLTLQQRRLAEKLKERLGYLGVYYKRDPKNFFRYLPQTQKQELLGNLKADYREIILNYFENNKNLNQEIDEFVNLCFFTDVSVSQIVEMHMELMDDFSKQLQMEGRREEILLDYRLTLIDVIAHLCEMYRRSIPREA